MKTRLSRVQIPPSALVHLFRFNQNLLIHDCLGFFDNMVVKKKNNKTTKKNAKKKSKKNDANTDFGIVIVDDDLTIDKEAELEERRAFLEEARSQDASSD